MADLGFETLDVLGEVANDDQLLVVRGGEARRASAARVVAGAVAATGAVAAQVVVIGARVSVAEQALDAAEIAAAALDGRVDQLETGAATLDGRLGTVEADTVALDGRVDTVEAGAALVDVRVGAVEQATALAGFAAELIADAIGAVADDAGRSSIREMADGSIRIQKLADGYGRRLDFAIDTLETGAVVLDERVDAVEMAAIAAGFATEPVANAASAETDDAGHWPHRVRPDGTFEVQKLEARAIGPQLREVIGEVAIGAGGDTAGLSAFQRIVLPAMQRGRLPRFSPLNPALPLLTKIGSGVGAIPSAGSGYPSLVRWTSPVFRWEGGLVQSKSTNDWSTLRTYNSTAFTAGLTGNTKYCNAARVEWMFDGASLMIGLMGGGASFRILVDDACIELPGGRIQGPDVYPTDGQMHVWRLDLGEAKARRIMIDAFGPIELHTIWLPAGTSVTVPAAEPRPVVYLDGTSIVEKGSGWANSFTRVMGVDSWNAAVGGSGIFNPGQAGRVNMRERANWRHRRFEFGVHQGLINDGDDAHLGSDGSYGDRFRRYADQYRYILEDWAASQDARPWFALGYLSSTTSENVVAPIYWPMRDAMDQVCGEFNQFATLIDPLPSAGALPGSGVNVSPQSYYLTAPDATHPNADGAAMLGRRIARQVGDLIRARRF